MESNPEAPSSQCDLCMALHLFVELCCQHIVTVETTLIISDVILLFPCGLCQSSCFVGSKYLMMKSDKENQEA